MGLPSLKTISELTEPQQTVLLHLAPGDYGMGPYPTGRFEETRLLTELC